MSKKRQVRRCIICNKKIKSLHKETENKADIMWNGGIVQKINAGYSSCFDGGVYIIAICDDCIKNNPDKIEFVKNYLSSSATR